MLGKVERSNRTLKRALAKLGQETEENWIKLLLIALLHMQSVPRDKLQLCAFELTYADPFSKPERRDALTPLKQNNSRMPSR